jgi:hypothetical protein
MDAATYRKPWADVTRERERVCSNERGEKTLSAEAVQMYVC